MHHNYHSKQRANEAAQKSIHLTSDASFQLALEQIPQARSITDLLFNPFEQRSEDATIMLSHHENALVEISLRQLRQYCAALFKSFKAWSIKAGL